VVQERGGEEGREVDPREQRGHSRAGRPHAGEAQVAVDESPRAHRVDDVRAHQSNGDRFHDRQRLQVAAERGVEQQRQQAPHQDVEVRGGQPQHLTGESPHRQAGNAHQRQDGERRGDEEAETDAVDQPTVALVQPAGPVRVRDERLEAEQEAHPEDRHGLEQDAADADGTNGRGAERPDDDGVHDRHGDPADLGEHHRPGQGHHPSQFVSPRHGPTISSGDRGSVSEVATDQGAICQVGHCSLVA